MFKELKEYCSCFSIQCEENPHVVFSNHFKLVLVELDKFKKRENIEHLDEKGLWSYILNWAFELTKKEKQDLKKRSKIMKEAVEKLTKQEMKQRLQLLEDFREKAREDFEYSIREQIREADREKGMKEGIEQTAIRMLNENFNIDSISKITKLSKSEIKKIKNLKKIKK